MTSESIADITNRFSYHRPDEKKAEKHEKIRGDMLRTAHYWNGELPDSREKALAITKLEEAMFWANAAIARN
jgi:hypothetical protein